jgi:hypothetical protein
MFNNPERVERNKTRRECFKKCVKDKTKVNNFAHEKKQKGIVDNSRLIQL